MYYGSSSPYTGLPYSYSSSVTPLGSSYSASYLNPGSSYNNHSSLSSYSRAPLSSRWFTSAGRNYSPILNTISERGSASPARIHSPRRIPISSRTYGTPNYMPRPVNINTADIDVSRDRYRHKAEPATPTKPEPPQSRVSTNTDSENGPFMPRVDGKPETGIDSSPGVERSTIKRGRTVVRLYTIKRNSPRKPTEESQEPDTTQDQEVEQKVNEDTKKDDNQFMKWREKLSDDLPYKEKKEEKTLGTKLVDKFKVKDVSAKELGTSSKVQKTDIESSQSLPTTPAPNINMAENKYLDRRCSMELLTEQANLLDSLIRNENLSTATLDLSKVGIAAEPKNNIEAFDSIKRRKSDNLQNPLKTTKSDYSLHDSLTSYKDVRDPRNFSKRRSIKKSSSGSCIRRLDSITEFPKELANVDLPAIEECRLSVKQDYTKQKAKPKLKTKITSSVEVSAPMSPLKFRIENVTVEEKPRLPKKEITYSSEVEEISPQRTEISGKGTDKSNEKNNFKKMTNKKNTGNELASPEPEDGNFWNKIGKRETVYLVKRKQNLDEAKQKHQRSLFWFPEGEEADNGEAIEPKNIIETNTNLNNSKNISETNNLKETDEDAQKVSIPNESIDSIIDRSDKIAPVSKIEFLNQEKDQQPKLKDPEIKKELEISNKKTIMNDSVTQIIPEQNPDITKEIAKDSSKLFEEYKVNSYTIISDECKSIGKSASMDAIDENKVKISSQNKTKSEKSKKLLKISDKTALKSLKSTIPKPSAKTEVLQKHESSTITEDASKSNIKLEQNVASVESIQKVAIDMPAVDQNKKSIERQSPIQSSADNKTIESNTTEINTTFMVFPKDLPEVEEKQNKLTKSTMEEPNDKMQKTTMNILMPSSEPSTSYNTTSKPAEQIVTAQLSESKTFDVIKDGKISQKSSSETKPIDNKAIVYAMAIGQNKSELPEVDKPVDKNLNIPSVLLENQGPSTSKATCISSKIVGQIVADLKISNSSKASAKSSPETKSKLTTPAKIPNDVTKSEKTDEVLKPTIRVLTSNEKSTSSSKLVDLSSKLANITTNGPVVVVPQTADISSSPIEPCLNGKIKTNDVTDIPVVFKSQDIPNKETELRLQTEQKTGEENKAENIIQKDEQPEISTHGAINLLAMKKKPVKEEKAVKPLIATPRPLQKKPPQVIHSSDSSDSSSEEESSEEDEDESEASEDSGEFYECDNNPDGRISTGSNDSGFDSSAPTSPATFSQIKKDCDVNCHRKCEKLTANLCGVNQRLLVEALASRTASRKGGEASGASSSAAPAHCNNTDILEQELEQSTAYDIFRKTGRFTPPARSIPRFRKYTVEDFQFIKVLGKGSFGKVLLAELRDTEYYYAVKCLKKDVVLEDDDVECTLIERKVLALGTNHPYLCHLFATFQTDSHLFFVMEYLNGGDLMFHIQQSGRFPEARARFYAAEIVSGLKFLHKRGIVYRDLKLDNILLDFEGHVRIADFGMCKLQIYLEKTADTFCGTPDYMAPEIIKGLKYNQTVDWWSFGVLLYEMLIGQSPFSGCDEDELFWSICNEMPSYPRFLSQEALTILTRLLDKDARTRLGGTECMHGDIREQGFFHPVHWDRLERRELETPFRPRVRHPMDTQYFDKAFTGERPRLTAVEPHVLRSMDQEPFRGFSYTNPNTTDR